MDSFECGAAGGQSANCGDHGKMIAAGIYPGVAADPEIPLNIEVAVDVLIGHRRRRPSLVHADAANLEPTGIVGIVPRPLEPQREEQPGRARTGYPFEQPRMPSGGECQRCADWDSAAVGGYLHPQAA